MTSLEAEQQRRSVIIYNVPPFMNMSNISPNVNDLPSQAGLNDCDVQSRSNHLQTSTTAFLKVIFVNESSSKTFLQSFRAKKRYWHSNHQEDVLLKIERDIPMQERLERVPFMGIIEALMNLATVHICLAHSSAEGMFSASWSGRISASKIIVYFK